jgi:DNA polymerase-3 subunit alpha
VLLTAHSWFSLRYGLMSPETLLQTARACGVKTLALTDVMNTSAAWEFVRLAREMDITPVLGIDFRKGDRLLYTALAQGLAGWRELCEFLSRGAPEGAASGPERAPDWEHVQVIYPWEAWKRWGMEDLAPREWEWIGGRWWEQDAIHWACAAADFPDAWKERLIAWHVGTFRHMGDWNAHRLLRAIDHNLLLSRLTPQQTGDPRDVFHSDALEAIAAIFPLERKKRGEEIMGKCGMVWPTPPEGQIHHNQHTYTGSEAEDERLVRQLCEAGIAYRYPADRSPAQGSMLQQVRERMEHELQVIQQQRFLSYFLINWDITSFARRQGFFYVGRGSGANSLVAYLLRITDVDPIELDLYFERFINLYRSHPPDFDIDFSWTDREAITAYIFRRFEHVALVGAYNTFQYRAAVRELGKVLGLPKHEIDALAHGKNTQPGELERLVLKYAARLQDFPNSITIHACGILIADKPIHHFCATFVPPRGFPTTQFDMIVAEDIGLYKFDILSQRGLAKIHDALALVQAHDPETAGDIDIHDLYRFKNDPVVKDLLREARAIGCFYVESPAMRMLLRKLQVDDYLGLVAASSVIRPGVARSGMMQAYIERHRHPEARHQAHPALLALMPETYGVMVYQEDVIKVAHHFAGLDLGEADVLRRGMSGKFRSREAFARAQEGFIQGAIRQGHSAEVAAEVWRQVESFAGYAFAKGHSASYAVESYQSLFLKAHWPGAYLTACINNLGGFYDTEFYVHEARVCGCDIEPPCVNRGAKAAVWDALHNRIFLGFQLVHGLEERDMDAWMYAREQEGAFSSLADFVQRVPIGLDGLSRMIRIGGFRFTGSSQQALLWEAHMLMGPGKKPRRGHTLFAAEPVDHDWPVEVSGALEQAYDQLELLGFPLVPPFALLEPEAAEAARHGIPADQLAACIGKRVAVAGYLVTVKETRTVNGDRMAFGCFLDAQGKWLDTVHFPPALRAFPFRGRGIYRIEGVVAESYGCLHVEASHMTKLAYRPDPRYAEDASPLLPLHRLGQAS